MANGQNPQLTPQELQKLVDLYKRVDGLTQAAATNMANQAQAAGNARAELERLNDIWNDFIKNISYAEQQFARIADKIKGQATGINKAAASYDKLRSIAAKVSDIQDGIRGSSEKELKSLREKLNAELKRLETAKDMLERQKQNARQAGDFKAFREAHLALLQVNATLADQQNYIAGINDALTEEEKHLRKVNETLGLAGATMKGMSKIPFLGDLPGMKEAMGEVNDEISEAIRDGKTVSQAEALGMAFKKMGGVVKDTISDPMFSLTFIFKQLKDAFLTIDDRAGKLAKTMNLSYEESLKMGKEFASIATAADEASVTSRRLEETYMAIGQSLGANSDINKEDLITMTKLREQAGYTNEELVASYKMSLLTGKSVKETTASFLGSAKALSAQKGLAINVKQLMKETASVSNAIKLSLGGTPKALAEAAVKAKEFGITLEQADKMASSLLNFEDSISAELEAELLTDKQINLENARYYALQGDIGSMAEEINREIGGSAEFTKMNRIQQEAYAKSVGMSREELANALVEQEALAKTGEKTAEAAKEKYDTLRKTMTAEEAAAALGNEDLARQYEQQNVQERFNQAVEKLKDIFVTIVDGPLGSFMSVIADILSNTTMLKVVFGGIAGLMIGSLLPSISRLGALMRLARMQGIGAAIVSVIKGAWESLGSIPFIGPILAGAAIAGGIALVQKYSTADDMVSPGYGKRTIKGPEGSIALNDKDTVIAGTDLFPKNKNNGASSASMSIDYDRLAAAMSKVQLRTSVNVNGREVASAVNNENNKTAVQTQ